MASRNQRRPNVVFILTDDHGPWALGCAGNPEIQTPNLDRLAANGMRFERFHCASPVCSPARATILTGRMPSQHGVHDWIRDGNTDPGAIAYLAGQVGYTDLLADAGYVCGISGKWHLGDSTRPQKGFTHWYVHQGGGGPYYGATMVREGRLVTEPGYVTDAITDDAITFLDRHATGDAPFYLSVHYTAPHSPWIGQHPNTYVDRYRDCAFTSCPDLPEHPWSLPSTVPAETRTRRRETLQGYFAAVSGLDSGVGRILATLDRHGLREDTLVLFTSDNGYNCGHHGIWGKGNGTYPQNMYDTSVLVPTIASHPGRIPAGAVTSALLSHYDIMPTLHDYLGLELPGHLTETLPGRSFAPLLHNPDQTNGGHEHVVVYDEYGPVRMIRTDEWKYVHRHPDGPDELYDLAHDPGEDKNLADEPGQQSIVRSLQVRLDDWFTRYSTPDADGTRQPVTGKGQRARINADRTQTDAFYPLETPPTSY